MLGQALGNARFLVKGFDVGNKKQSRWLKGDREVVVRVPYTEHTVRREIIKVG